MCWHVSSFIPQLAFPLQILLFTAQTFTSRARTWCHCFIPMMKFSKPVKGTMTFLYSNRLVERTRDISANERSIVQFS
ncbi:hypothetical protein F4780DRAFT_235237 [Xylariomycetidae sp. FL0641]|nr:hypothetical protein F4780DRAFT_235237 [Xylariomycetidae sp. FL0641]